MSDARLLKLRLTMSHSILTTRIVLVVLGLAAIIVIMPATPSLHTVPYRDSGVFLYVGSLILDGAVPYRDVWDHKPPLIHFVNAAGLFIGGRTRWGVWLLEVTALIAATWIGYLALARRLSRWSAFLASVSWVSAVPFVLEMGNCTEEYGLPLQMATVAAFFHLSREREPGPLPVSLLGSLGALLLLLRPNLAGLPLIAVVVLAVPLARRRKWASLVRFGTSVLAGGAVVLLPVVAWFALHNALADLVRAAITYNVVYSSADLAGRLAALGTGVRLTAMPGTVLLAAGGWVVAVVGLISSQSRQSAREHALLWLAVVAFPAEFALASMAGRQYPHYFLSVLPVCALLAGLLLHQIEARIRTGFRPRVASFGVPVAVILSIGAVLGAREVYRQLLYSPPDLRALYTVSIINDRTTAEDRVLVWGAEATVNFLSGRRSPTRYVYQYPLFTRGYGQDELVDRLISDLEADPPRLVVDTSQTNTIIPPLSVRTPLPGTVPESPYVIPASIDRVRTWIDDRYRPFATSEEWQIWERHP